MAHRLRDAGLAMPTGKESRSTNSFDAIMARKRCLAYRRRILDISQNVPALHIAPAFSCVEMVDAIYHGMMRRTPDGEFADTFLMSKGHGCMVQYVILAEEGVLSDDDLATYCTPKGRLGAHPDYGVPGIAASTGSLGHGMGLSAGMAYGDRLKGDDRMTYVLSSPR
jgi:transketolase